MQLTRSLEDYRRELLLDIGEFARYLGVTEQTYRRLLLDPERVRMITKRQVRDRLQVPTALIAELAPRASVVLQEQTRAAVAEADRDGWVAYASEMGIPTGEVFDGQGARWDS